MIDVEMREEDQLEVRCRNPSLLVKVLRERTSACSKVVASLVLQL